MPMKMGLGMVMKIIDDSQIRMNSKPQIVPPSSTCGSRAQMRLSAD